MRGDVVPDFGSELLLCLVVFIVCVNNGVMVCAVGVWVCGIVVSHILEDLYNLARSSGGWDRNIHVTHCHKACHNHECYNRETEILDNLLPFSCILSFRTTFPRSYTLE